MVVGAQGAPSENVTNIPTAIGHLSLGFGHFQRRRGPFAPTLG
jgi:hypothetical protein